MLKLNNEVWLAIERQEKRARLIVYKNDIQDVCRKETFGNLSRFMHADKGHLFRGRLQLDKDGGNIAVHVKGQLVGTVKAEDFWGYLERVKIGLRIEKY